MTDESIMSVDILRNRWKLFGHTLRMDEDTPAHKSMVHYFTGSQAGRFRGRPRVNMPRKLDEDLKKYSNDREELKSMDDLHVLKRLARNRKRWKNMIEVMCAAAKAEKNTVSLL